MNLRDAAQQALEVIGWLRLHLQRDHQCLHMDSTGSGIPAWIAKSQTAIRAALAEPQPEPVAWVSKHALDRIKDFDGTIYANGGFDDAVPLYAHPPQRQPLSDEEIIRIGIEARAVEGTNILPITFARAIELAHGIGGDK